MALTNFGFHYWVGNINNVVLCVTALPESMYYYYDYYCC